MIVHRASHSIGVSGSSRVSEYRGHPLAAPVNRDEHISATLPASVPVQSRYSQPLSSPHTWFSNHGCAVAHQSPIRIKAVMPCGAWPLTASAAPENPLYLIVSNPRDRSGRSPNLWLRMRRCDPTPCGSRCGHNELFGMAGPTAACNQISWFFQPQHDTVAVVPLSIRAIRRPSTLRRSCRPS